MNSFGQRKAAKKLDEAGLWDYAMRLLAARGYSEAEIRQKLRRRAIHAPDTAAVLGRLREADLLNDVRFAESFARARLENQGHGRFRVLRELRGRQVPDAIARDAADKIFQETDEAELIEQYLRRKFRGTSLAEHLADPRRLASAYRRLRTAGFGSANSIRILKRYADRAEELESMESAEL
jgi:regulatory protein